MGVFFPVDALNRNPFLLRLGAHWAIWVNPILTLGIPSILAAIYDIVCGGIKDVGGHLVQAACGSLETGWILFWLFQVAFALKGSVETAVDVQWITTDVYLRTGGRVRAIDWAEAACVGKQLGVLGDY